MTKWVGLGFALKMNSTLVGQLRSMSHSGASGSPVDITCFDDLSTGDRFMRKAAGIADPGQLTMELAYDASTTYLVHRNLMSHFSKGDDITWVVVWPTTTTLESFSGHVASVGQEIPFGELVTCSVTVEKTGIPGFNPQS